MIAPGKEAVKMKKTCMILAMICLALAIVCMALSIVSAKPKVSEMSDRQLMGFIQKYGLDQHEEVHDLEQLRTMADTFEKTGVVNENIYLSSFTYSYLVDLTNALADYYDRPWDALN